MEADRHVIRHIDAVVRIITQRLDIARANALDEETEIATEIVDARDSRAAHEIFYGRNFTGPQIAEHALQHPTHRNELAQKRRREARRPRRTHKAPDCLVGRADRQIDLVEAGGCDAITEGD